MFLYGASGHGKVIKEILEANGEKVEGFIDDDKTVNELAHLPVYHDADNKFPLIISIGSNKVRKMIVERLNCTYGIAIHPSAIVSPSAKIGEGTVVMPGAIINADAVIGQHCIINTGAIVDHDCVIEDYCHIAPHATLCGIVHVGEGTLIGVGSCVKQCINLGRWSVLGAGSVVVRDIPDDVVAFGNPCKVRR